MTERTYARALLKIDFDFEFDLAREEDVKVTAVTPVPFPAFPWVLVFTLLFFIWSVGREEVIAWWFSWPVKILN